MLPLTLPVGAFSTPLAAVPVKGQVLSVGGRDSVEGVAVIDQWGWGRCGGENASTRRYSCCK
jgi:hypothetical protein